MNAKQANTFSIIEYLEACGHMPAKIRGDSHFYLSPYRPEDTASLKVSQSKNLWVDYGDQNAGGSLIDLVLKINPDYTVSDAIQEITRTAGDSFSFHRQISDPDPNPPGIQIRSIKDLGNNRSLTGYLNERGIQLTTAERYCREIYFSTGGKSYFGIGNRNENGWSIRNRYWKGCSAQGISYYPTKGQQLSVFEGIFDLLSFLELKQEPPIGRDYLVLNSLSNIPQAGQIIKRYKDIDLYLDKDVAGIKATKELLKTFPNSRDKSALAGIYTDLNEYLLKAKGYAIRR